MAPDPDHAVADQADAVEFHHPALAPPTGQPPEDGPEGAHPIPNRSLEPSPPKAEPDPEVATEPSVKEEAAGVEQAVEKAAAPPPTEPDEPPAPEPCQVPELPSTPPQDDLSSPSPSPPPPPDAREVEGEADGADRDTTKGSFTQRPTSPRPPQRRLKAAASPPMKRQYRTSGFEVILHVYDLLNQECKADIGVTHWNLGRTLTALNDTTLRGMNLGFFHAGVEVLNTEFSFGWCAEGTGVYSCQPRSSPGYTYRDSIPMGTCQLSRVQIDRIIRQCAREWTGDSYNLVERNCCGFCNHLCVELEVGECPAWVNNLANSFVPLSRGAAAMTDFPRRMSESFVAVASLASTSSRDRLEDDEEPPLTENKGAVTLGDKWEILDTNEGDSSLEPPPQSVTTTGGVSSIMGTVERYFCGQDSPYTEVR